MTTRCRGAQRRRKVWRAVLVAFLVGVLPCGPAFADDSPSPENAADAKRRFAHGSSLYLEGQYARALELLQSSYDLAPSPNSELLMARCLRELGRPVDAYRAFTEAEAEARRRVASGSQKYAKTADSAAAEGAAVRSTLGSLHIHVDGVDDKAKLEIDGVAAQVPPGGDWIVLRAAGTATLSLRSESGQEQRQTVTLGAGAEVTVGFSRPEPPPPPTPVPAPLQAPATPAPLVEPATPMPSTPTHTRWIRSAAIASGAVTVAGGGAFIGFGLASEKAFNDLNGTCGDHCGTAGEQSRAQTGKMEQVVANVSLVVGSAAAAATLAFVLVAIFEEPTRKASASPKPRWAVGPFGVEGEF